jgi:hypothetical protein
MAAQVLPNDASPGKVNTTYFAVGVGFAQVIGNNERRRNLVVTCPSAGTLIVSWDPSPPSVNGVILTAGQFPLVLTRETHGALVTQPLYLASPGGAQTVAIVEEEGLSL